MLTYLLAGRLSCRNLSVYGQTLALIAAANVRHNLISLHPPLAGMKGFTQGISINLLSGSIYLINLLSCFYAIYQ